MRVMGPVVRVYLPRELGHFLIQSLIASRNRIQIKQFLNPLAS